MESIFAASGLLGPSNIGSRPSGYPFRPLPVLTAIEILSLVDFNSEGWIRCRWMVKPARNLVKLVCVFHKTKAAKEEFQGGGSTTTPLLRALLDWRREQQSRQDLPSEEAITQGSIKVLILVVPEKMVSMMAREVHVNESENAKSSPGVL